MVNVIPLVLAQDNCTVPVATTPVVMRLGSTICGVKKEFIAETSPVYPSLIAYAC